VFAIGRNDRYCASPVNMTLDERRTNTNMLSMDSRDCLAQYPFVVVRIRCRVCARKGSYRLARIAAKYGPEITLRDLLDRFSYDCLWRTQSRTKRGQTDCGVYLAGP
jgi:hypothetical protein